MRRPVLRSCCWAGRWLRPRAVSRAAAARPVDLAYNLINGRNSETPLVFLHGLLGSKSNFHSISKALFQRTGRTVVTVDSRNHGDSGHSPVMTYEAMSLDLQNMLNKLELPECILLGHSMGGKIAMTTALQNPRLVKKLVVVDISPVRTISQTAFPDYIAAMKAVTVDATLSRSSARTQADKQLQLCIKDARTRQFILTNLVECNGQYIWRVNLEAIANSLDYLLGFPDFNTPFTAPTIFLGGVNSSYISSKEYPEIKRLFPNSIIQHVPEAGHWVHSEKPYDFINAICAFLGTS
ncbi:sn-1-specific diacylglycerol lipase ABHD11 isoform X1 [Mobula birostris]|uniref:sn-1-specific diacylglycerol lipase ABHD11 isoform X1 n=1 Tax=Mobula birostris TaxID=1983395 RepID=UPI003B27BD6F